MIRKSGNRFFEKIMLKPKGLPGRKCGGTLEGRPRGASVNVAVE